ncbi:MAG: hypothetical protein GY846_22570, partial [Deltaproteobacteria bacterium]|nr:hypothetical protein [Deltaproteobacteria bacterium]
MNHLIHRLKKIGLKPCTLFKGKQKGPDSLPSDIPDVETLGGLSDVAATLDTICRDAEPRFLEIGEKLQAFYFEATGLAQQTLDAVKLVGGDSDEGVLAKVKGVSRNALHELEGRQARIGADLDNAKAVVEQLEGLFSICSVLDKISLSLGVVGLNIGIEGAGSEQAQEKFTEFSSDIRRLSERIAKIAKAILENAKSAMTTQRSTCAQISSGLVRLETLAADAGVTVQGAVRQVEDLTGVFFEAMDKAGKHSNEISQRVGDIVMAIQFHDNMRQRVAHIVEGLDVVQSLSKEGAPGDEKKG